MVVALWNGCCPCAHAILPPALDLLIRVEGALCHSQDQAQAGARASGRQRQETQALGSSDQESLPKAREAGRKGVVAGTLCKM